MSGPPLESEAARAAAHLADRFESDARALRARRAKLGGAAPRGGPDAAACDRMAAACDRVAAIFTNARRDAAPASLDALGALVPVLERAHAEERAPDARHVYAGALTRLREALGEDGAGDDEDGDRDDA